MVPINLETMLRDFIYVSFVCCTLNQLVEVHWNGDIVFGTPIPLDLVNVIDGHAREWTIGPVELAFRLMHTITCCINH